MTRDQILDVMRTAAGDPDSGPVKEWLPALADAVDAALNPKAKPAKFDSAELEVPQ